MPGTQPPKKWIGPRASSKQFQDLRLRSCDSNLCYSMQVASKNFQKPILYRKKSNLFTNVIWEYTEATSTLCFRFFVSNLPAIRDFDAFFSIVAHPVPKFAEFCQVMRSFLQSWHAVARMNSCNFSALSRNFFSQLLRIFSQLLRIFSQLLRLRMY